MSLYRIAVRCCIVEMLRNQTLIGDNVHDSVISAFDLDHDGKVIMKPPSEGTQEGDVTSEDGKPFIAVYTSGLADKKAFSDYLDNGPIELSIEWGVSTLMCEYNDKGESTLVGVGLRATDDSIEFMLDLVWRQIATTFHDENNKWSEHLRKLISGTQSMQRLSVANDAEGTRVAGHQAKIVYDLPDDPKGTEQQDLMNFLDDLEQSDRESHREKATMIKGLLGAVDQEEVDRSIQKHNLSKPEAKSLFGWHGELYEPSPPPADEGASNA